MASDSSTSFAAWTIRNGATWASPPTFQHACTRTTPARIGPRPHGGRESSMCASSSWPNGWRHASSDFWSPVLGTRPQSDISWIRLSEHRASAVVCCGTL